MKKWILFVCCILPWSLMAQIGYSDWEILYQDAGLKVEIQYKLSSTSCQNTGKQSKFRYRVNGSSSYTSYLNWKMDYIDCNGNLHFTQYSLDIGRNAKKGILESLDYLFNCQSLEQPYYEAKLSHSPSSGSGLIANAYSKDPHSISGKDEVYGGQSTTLKIVGGTLGAGAKWYWYDRQCSGSPLGTGRELIIAPIQTTTYYARAEGYNNNTNCVSITVEVNQNSLTPTGISGRNKVCVGEATTLEVQGGALGHNAEWVWYEGACDGRRIGTGPSITISPKKATQYFVRAEGTYNTTVCASIYVSSSTRSAVPVEARASATEICEGEEVRLSVTGSAAGNWKWSEDASGRSQVGSGEAITVRPSRTTTYYVRGAGGCDESIYKSITIEVNRVSRAATGISYDRTVTRKEPVTLTVTGGELGEGAKWVWYQNSCGGKVVGTGKTYTALFTMPTTLYVRAEGDCNLTECLKEKVVPVKEHKFHPLDTYDGYNNKFMHVGAGLGLDVMSFSLPDEQGDISGFGLKAEVVYHPYYKDHFNIGLIASYAIGTTPLWLVGGDFELGSGIKEETYSYNRFEIGAEAAIRAPIGKLSGLVSYKNSFQDHSFSQIFYRPSQDDEAIDFNLGLRKQTLGIGVQFGPYRMGPKDRGMVMDARYTLSRDYSWNWDKSTPRNNVTSDWQSGAEFGVWVHSILKFQYNLSWDTQLGHYIPPDTDSDFTQYHQFSIIYNRNAFR